MDAETERLIRELQAKIKRLEDQPLPSVTGRAGSRSLEEPEVVVRHSKGGADKGAVFAVGEEE